MTRQTMEWTRVLRWMQRRVAPGDDAMRVDRWLRQQFPSVPQSFLQKQLRQRKIRVLASSPEGSEGSEGSASVPAKPNMTLHSGAIVAIDAVVFEMGLKEELVESGAPVVSEETTAFAETLVERVVYADDNYLVLNKPHGLAVQDGTSLEHSLASYLPSLGAAFENGETPRLVHRLDKETSGLLVLARHRLAAARFSELLRDGNVRKTYDALVRPVHGTAVRIPLRGEITLPIDGKPAKSVFRRLSRPHERGDGSLWLEMQPLTGRKHQLRIHCAKGLHAPIVGDLRHATFASARLEDRLFLHARQLKFPNPFHPGRNIEVACEMEPTPGSDGHSSPARKSSQNPTTTPVKTVEPARKLRKNNASIPGTRSVSRREEGRRSRASHISHTRIVGQR